MRQAQGTIAVQTGRRGLLEVTGEIGGWLAEQRVETGLLTVFIRHTSASLTIQENADPAVLHDLEAFFARQVPDDPSRYRHTAEGPDDMPAHIRAALTQTHLSIPVERGRMALGTWQGIYLYEHRQHAHARRVVAHIIGE